jgi:hypothetical protein
MEFLATIQEVATPGHTPRTLMTLGVALLFAAIYVLGGRASQVFGESGLRRFH